MYGMSQERWDAALVEDWGDIRTRVSLSDYDRAAILFMAEDRRPLNEIAAAIGRGLNTVKTEMFRLRRAGVLQTSYYRTSSDWHAPDRKVGQYAA